MGLGGIPVIPIGTDRDDPLRGVAIAEQRLEPAFEPGLRSDGAGSILLGILVVQLGHHPIDHAGDLVEVEDLEIIADRDAQPKLAIILMQGIPDLAEKAVKRSKTRGPTPASRGGHRQPRCHEGKPGGSR